MTTPTRRTDTKVEPPETYFFTYSPIGNTKCAEFTYYDHLVFYFKHWHQCMSQFEINPEFNANGNLHYHGYFVLKDKVRWYRSVLPKLKYNGLVKIDRVKHDLSKSMEYCRKDNLMMKQIIKKYPVPYTHLDKTLLTKPDIIQDNIYAFLKEMDRVKESRAEMQRRVFVKTDLDTSLEELSPNVSH